MSGLVLLPVNAVKVGMYIEKFQGPWMASPFWQRQMLLDNEKDLQLLRASAIQQVWINPARSLSLPSESISTAQELYQEPESVEDQSVNIPPKPLLCEIASVAVSDELKNAAVLIKKSREAVQSMFMEARMGRAVAMEDAADLVEEIASSVLRNSEALIGLARLKTSDDYTYMHSVAVCALMISLGKRLQLNDDQLREVGMAGLLHDIGKMAVPNSILQKPGRLTDLEFVQVKQHPEAGWRMLTDVPNIPTAALDVCLHHHEKLDGSGYPERLHGDQISLYARMGAVCDVYDAITSNRPYKSGWCPAESLRKMAEWSKGHFDERIFAAFVRCLGIYPIGTLVRLQSGRMGVVVEQTAGAPLTQPKVRVFFSAKSRSYIRPELLDLARPSARDSIVATEVAENWGLDNINRYWSGELDFS